MVWKYYAYNFFRELTLFSAVLVPFYTIWGGISLAEVQILQSWFMLWVFLLEVPTGAIADYLGRKHSLVFGALCAMVAAVIYSSVPRLEIFLIGEFLFAAAMALSSGADQAWLYDSLKDAGREHESKKIFSRAHAFTLGGIMIASLLGSGIAALYGLNAPMRFSAIAFGVAAVIAMTMKEPKRHGEVSERTRYIQIVKKGFVYFYHHRILRLLALDVIIINAAGYFVIWLHQPLLQAINIPLVYFGFGFALMTATEILISANFERLERLFGSGKKFFSYTALIIALIYIAAAVTPNIYTVVFFIAIAGGFGMTRTELMSIYMHPHIPSEQRATILSSISMFKRFALVILNPIVGFAAGYSLSGALLLVSVLPVAVFLFSPVTHDMFEE